MPDEEDLVYDDDMRTADVAALATIMMHSEFMARCERRLGVEKLAQMQENHSKIDGEEGKHVGQIVEEVVTTYEAPHLRPVSILERAGDENAADPACYSLMSLLNYAVA